MNVERVAPEDWPRLGAEWSRLLEQASQPEIFLSPEWIISWFRHFRDGREPFLLAARDEAGALVGVAPLYRRRLTPLPLTRLSLLGDEGVGSEYLGMLVRKGAEPAFLEALSRALAGEYALADLHGLRAGHEGSEALIRRLGAVAPSRIHRERLPCSAIQLPGDYESYLASLASKFRTTLRYRTNKLTKSFQVRLLRTDREDQIEAHLERFFAMHQGRWTAEGHSGSFHHPRKRTFYREISEGFLRRGWLRFYHLEVDGVIRAAQFGFAFSGVLLSLQEAFDDRFRPQGVGGVGVVLRGMAIRECIAEGLTSYDFLGGEEEFKTRWGTTTHFVERARIGAPGLAGALAYAWSARSRDGRLWLRRHLPARWVDFRDRLRVRRQARKARAITEGSGEISR